MVRPLLSNIDFDKIRPKESPWWSSGIQAFIHLMSRLPEGRSHICFSQIETTILGEETLNAVFRMSPSVRLLSYHHQLYRRVAVSVRNTNKQRPSEITDSSKLRPDILKDSRIHLRKCAIQNSLPYSFWPIIASDLFPGFSRESSRCPANVVNGSTTKSTKVTK